MWNTLLVKRLSVPFLMLVAVTIGIGCAQVLLQSTSLGRAVVGNSVVSDVHPHRIRAIASWQENGHQLMVVGDGELTASASVPPPDSSAQRIVVSPHSSALVAQMAGKAGSLHNLSCTQINEERGCVAAKQHDGLFVYREEAKARAAGASDRIAVNAGLSHHWKPVLTLPSPIRNSDINWVGFSESRMLVATRGGYLATSSDWGASFSCFRFGDGDWNPDKINGVVRTQTTANAGEDQYLLATARGLILWRVKPEQMGGKSATTGCMDVPLAGSAKSPPLVILKDGEFTALATNFTRTVAIAVGYRSKLVIAKLGLDSGAKGFLADVELLPNREESEIARWKEAHWRGVSAASQCDQLSSSSFIPANCTDEWAVVASNGLLGLVTVDKGGRANARVLAANVGEPLVSVAWPFPATTVVALGSSGTLYGHSMANGGRSSSAPSSGTFAHLASTNQEAVVFNTQGARSSLPWGMKDTWTWRHQYEHPADKGLLGGDRSITMDVQGKFGWQLLNGKLYRTSNLATQAWQHVAPTPGSERALDLMEGLLAGDEQRLWAWGPSARVAVSENGGTTWRDVSIPQKEWRIKESAPHVSGLLAGRGLPEGAVWLASSSGYLFHRPTDKASWGRVCHFLDSSFISLKMTERYLWAITSRGDVFVRERPSPNAVSVVAAAVNDRTQFAKNPIDTSGPTVLLALGTKLNGAPQSIHECGTAPREKGVEGSQWIRLREGVETDSAVVQVASGERGKYLFLLRSSGDLLRIEEPSPATERVAMTLLQRSKADRSANPTVSPQLIAVSQDGRHLVAVAGRQTWTADANESTPRLAWQGTDVAGVASVWWRWFGLSLLLAMPFAALIWFYFVDAPYRSRRRHDKAVDSGAISPNVLRSDQAIDATEHDRLGHATWARALKRLIGNTEADPPLTLAVVGAWGTGKTSVLRMLGKLLTNPAERTAGVTFLPVHVNAWHHQGENDLLEAVVQALQRELLQIKNWRFLAWLYWRRVTLAGWGTFYLMVPIAAYILKDRFPQEPGPWSWGLLAAILWSSIEVFLRAGAQARVVNSSGRAENFQELIFRQRPLQSVREKEPYRSRFARQFRDVCEVPYHRLVLIVDDLDRCPPTEMAGVIETINFLTDAGQCNVVLGLSREPLEAALRLHFKDFAVEQDERPRRGSGDVGSVYLKARRRFVREYLEKIINLEMHLPKQVIDKFKPLTSQGVADPWVPAPLQPAIAAAFCVGLCSMVLVVYLQMAGDRSIRSGRSPHEIVNGGLAPNSPVRVETAGSAAKNQGTGNAPPGPVRGDLGKAGPVVAVESAKAIQDTLPNTLVTGDGVASAEVPRWVYYGTAATLLVLVGLFIMRSRRGVGREAAELNRTDSNQLKGALEKLTAYLEAVEEYSPERWTPRGIKRLTNEIRLMVALDTEDIDQHASVSPLAAIQAEVLVALTALRVGLGHHWLSKLRDIAFSDELLVKLDLPVDLVTNADFKDKISRFDFWGDMVDLGNNR